MQLIGKVQNDRYFDSGLPSIGDLAASKNFMGWEISFQRKPSDVNYFLKRGL